MVKNLYGIQCYNLGEIQMVAMAASLFSVIWNTMEWNWVGACHECYDAFLTRLKLFPLYTFSTLYKCISISVIVGYLRWYSAPMFFVIIVALTLLDFVIRKNYSKSIHLGASKYANIQNTNENEKFVHKYKCKLLI